VELIIDQWMPQFRVSEIHSIRIDAPVQTAYTSIRRANLADSAVLRTLLVARALPAALKSGRGGELRRVWGSPVDLHRFEESGFRILEEREPTEIVIGLEGRFWTLAGDVCHHDRAEFLKPIPQGVVRAMWNFSLTPLGPSACELATETRVNWTDPNAGRSFLRYWRFIRSWSGLTRMIMLRAIKRAAEGSREISEAGKAARN
jgi:hypothetical protein